jgi:hypothetical protein
MALAAQAQQAPDSDSAPVNPLITVPSSGNGSYLVLGDLIRGPLNVETPPADNGCLGVEYAWGKYWVTGRKNAVAAGPHQIYRYDLSGALEATFIQGGAAGSTWGGRDCDVDETLNKLWTGQEASRLDEYDHSAGTLTYATSYTITGGPSIVRALCRRPSDGHFFTANFNSTIQEFTINPVAIVATNPANGKAHYGLAWEYVNNTLWSFAQNHPTGGAGGTGDLVEFNEMSTAGALLGPTFLGTLYGVAGTNIAGGADIYQDPLNDSHNLSIVGLHQNTLDEVNAYDLGVLAGCNGSPTVYCTAKVNSLGCTPAIGSSGIPSATAGSGFNVTCANVRNQKSGLLFYKVNGTQTGVAFQGGFLCVGPSGIKRTGATSSGGNALPANDCSGNYSTDMNAFALSAGPPIPDPGLQVPGNIVHCQQWGRDQGFPAPNNTTLSDGLEYEICP